MKTGSILAVTVAGGLALTAIGVTGCASSGKSRRLTREEKVKATLSENLGFRGRMLVVDLSEVETVRLRSARLEGDMLQLRDVHHRLMVLKRADLMPKWEYHGFGDALRYDPTANATSLLAMSENTLHQVNRRFGNAEGAPIHFDMTPSANFVATVGTAYVPSWGGSRGQKTLRTINLVNGLEGWGYRTAGDIRGDMAIAGTAPRQTVYFATDAGDVYALPASGADLGAPEVTWTQKTRGSVTAGVVINGDHLFVASHDSAVYCMDRVTGAIRWATFLDHPLTMAPAVTATAVYQMDGDAIVCLDRASGVRKWTVNNASHFVVEREGKVLLQSKSGHLWSVDADGTVGAKASPGRYSYVPNTTDGTIYAVANDGFVVSLEVGGE